MDITGFIFELLTLTADLITGGGLVKIATFLLSLIFSIWSISCYVGLIAKHRVFPTFSLRHAAGQHIRHMAL